MDEEGLTLCAQTTQQHLTVQSEVVPTVEYGILISFNALAALGVIINALHLGVIFLMPNSERIGSHNYRTFVVFLAASDMIVSLVRVVLSNEPAQNAMIQHPWICRMSSVVVTAILIFQTNLLLLASIDRYLAVKISTAYHRNWYAKHIKLIYFSTLITWLSVYGAISIGYSEDGYSVKGLGSCMMGSKEQAQLGVVNVLTVLAILLIIIGFYMALAMESIRISGQMEVSSRERRFVRGVLITITALILAKVLLWLPILATVVLRAMKRSTAVIEAAGLVTMVLYSVCNPILYGLISKRYRKSVHTMVTQLCEEGARKSGSLY